MSLVGRTVVISGASRGIGKAIAIRCAKEGANIAILAKSTQENPRLPGTIYTTAEEVEKAGGKALPVACDIRFAEQITEAVEKVVDKFGGIDVLINNASAISLTDTLNSPVKKWDLLQTVCVRGTFLLTQAALPHLLKSPFVAPRVIIMCPPMPHGLQERHLAPHLPYSIAKYGMSMCVIGWAGEFRGRVAVNGLWPRTLIDTVALNAIWADGQSTMGKRGRRPQIMADACLELLNRGKEHSGVIETDEQVLSASGITDFTQYAVDPLVELSLDLFLDSKL